MPRYEYKVVPAPAKGLKGKGIKGAEARFSHGLQELMNGLAGYGWEYQRAETLPSIERAGLTGTTTEWRNVLIFRRPRENDAEAFAPELLPAPDAVPTAAPDAKTAEAKVPSDEAAKAPTAETDTQGTSDPAADNEADNGVEDTGTMHTVGASLSQLASARESLKTKS